MDTNSRTMARRLLIQPVKMSMVLSRSMQPNARWLPYLDVKMQLDNIEVNQLLRIRSIQACYDLLFSLLIKL